MTCWPKSVAPFIAMSRALLPRIDIQIIMNAIGSVRVPATKVRIVRPREMRARNRPTNGPQAIHQAQKNRVQPFSHSVGRSKA